MEKSLEQRITELEKRVAELEGQVQAQPNTEKIIERITDSVITALSELKLNNLY